MMHVEDYPAGTAAFNQRKFCTMECRARWQHKERGDDNPRQCECGQPATTSIKCIQLSPEGRSHDTTMNLCEDCKQLWNEEEAERIALVGPFRQRDECTTAGIHYHAQATSPHWHQENARRTG